MTNVAISKAKGFGLLEIVIALVVIIGLAVATIPLVTHFGWRLVDGKKIKTSIERLHEAANSYYYNEIVKNKEPISSLTIPNLIKNGYIKADDIYHYHEGISKPSEVYKYSVELKSGNGNQYFIEIIIETRQNIQDLHGLNPTENKLACPGTGSKCKVRAYYWRYPISLDTYKSITKHRISRSVVFARHVADT